MKMEGINKGNKEASFPVCHDASWYLLCMIALKI